MGSDSRSTLWLLPWEAVIWFLVTIFIHLKVEWRAQSDLQTSTPLQLTLELCSFGERKQKWEGKCFCLWACLCVSSKSAISKNYCVFVNVWVGERQTEPARILTLPVIGRPCSPEPPNTKCVWVAALGDKMAISRISQPSISFWQIGAVAGVYRCNRGIDWTGMIHLSEQDEGGNLRNHREDAGG